jgi:hypothetical protein
MRYYGTVARKVVARGSKSERDAVCLAAENGEYILRRQGGNPFSDPQLDALVGKRISCEGETIGNVLLVSGWEIL